MFGEAPIANSLSFLLTSLMTRFYEWENALNQNLPIFLGVFNCFVIFLRVFGYFYIFFGFLVFFFARMKIKSVLFCGEIFSSLVSLNF
jgi:hypothetical protein